jgi:mRNA-degrading endonuclease RelE of RelBE toxin-antitoxin system
MTRWSWNFASSRGRGRSSTWLPHAVRDRIKVRIEAYAAAPHDPRHDVVALVGTRSGYRLRVGKWRVIFAVVEGRMDVTRVMHRREAYR